MAITKANNGLRKNCQDRSANREPAGSTPGWLRVQGLGKPVDFSESRAPSHAEVAEVRPRLPLVGAQIELVERYPTSYWVSSESILMKRKRYNSANICPFRVHADRRR